jgi:hypothetical protein
VPGDIKLAINSDKPGPIRPITVGNVDNPARIGAKSRLVATFAVGEKARQISGIVTDQAGATVAPGPYLDTTDLGYLTALPETVALDPWIGKMPGQMKGGLTAAVFEDDKSKPLWLVYSLPSAGRVEIPTRAGGMPLDRVHGYSVIHLELGADFDERAVDGVGAMKKLTRFARSSCYPKKAETTAETLR